LIFLHQSTVSELLVVGFPLLNNVFNILAVMRKSRVDLSINSIFELDIFDLISVELDVGLNCQAMRSFVVNHNFSVF